MTAVSWLLTIAGFSVLIIIHEFGHFIVAKRTGMRVERFFLFFPPKLVSVRRGETEYGIGAIPVGGFVKITGMNPDEKLPPELAARGYYAQPVWKRVAVIAAGPVMNLLLAFVLLFALAFGAQRLNDTVGSIDAGSPAARHLDPGDRVLAVDGKSFPNASLESRLGRFTRLVASHKCTGRPTDGCRARTPVRLRIERDGRVRTLAIRPEYDSDIGRTRLGYTYGLTPTDPSIPAAAGDSVTNMWRVTSGTVSVFGRIFETQQRQKIHGIVGISDVTHQAFELGARQALFLLGVISLALALINLFPFLPLDGGHIFWSLVERIRGRPIPFSVIERASVVGFVLVMMLFVVGLSNDIGRLTGNGFHVR